MKQQAYTEATAKLVKQIPLVTKLDESMACQLVRVNQVREVWADVLYRERERRDLVDVLEAVAPCDASRQIHTLEIALEQAAVEHLELVSA